MGFTYKCLIVDDEKPAHLVLKSHINSCRNLEFIASLYNGEEALEFLNHNQIDIVFLDIQMPLLNGIEVIQKLNNKPAIILTTAYCDFAFEAFQLDVIDYLLKPIHFSRFVKSIEKIKLFFDTKKQSLIKTIKIKSNGSSFEINPNDIIYIQSIGNYIKIFTTSNSKAFLAYFTLKNLLKELPTHLFSQTHKSYLVNQNFIKFIKKDKIILENDEILPIGRKYKILLE